MCSSDLGQTIDAFWVSIAHARPFSVGVNCALGARDMRPYVEELARDADCYISCYPNAGLPNAFGEYDEHPHVTAELLREFAQSGLVNIVGGCCGTTPDHIRAIAEAVRDLPPRRIPEIPERPRFSGLERLEITGRQLRRPTCDVGEQIRVLEQRHFDDLGHARDAIAERQRVE